MSKRMTRLRPENALEKLKNLTGISLNVVLKNGNTYFGTLLSVSQELVIIVDTRQHTHKILIPEVYEIIYDYENV